MCENTVFLCVNLIDPSTSHQTDQESIIADLIQVTSQLEPFTCILDEVQSFPKVIFLKPDKQSTNRMQQVHSLLLQQVFKHVTKWRREFKPHCTIAQPVDKRNCQHFVQSHLEPVRALFNNKPLEFFVDCIHWLQRPANKPDEPFAIRFSFAFGQRLPSTVYGLAPMELAAPKNILNFLVTNQMILSEAEDQELVELAAEAKQSLQDYNQDVQLVGVGSYQFGIKCNDLDFALVTSHSGIGNWSFFK